MRKLIRVFLVAAALAAGVIAFQTPAHAWVSDYCHETAEACLWEHEHFQGRVLNLWGHIDNFVDFGFNDLATSTLERRPYCWFWDILGKGGYMPHFSDNPVPNVGPYWNDKISSGYPC
jgi:hypothetical protein